MAPEATARLLVSSGVNSHVVEGMAAFYAPDGWNDIPFNDAITPLIRWVKAMQNAGIWTVIHWANGNDDNIIRMKGMAVHKAGLERLYTECGVRYIVLIPVAEMQSDEDTEFSAWAINFWHSKGGICGWNGKGRPQKVPANCQVCDYHLQALDDLGPDLNGIITLLDTDNGPAINALRAYWNPDKVQNWAGVYRKAGRSLNLYQFQSTEVDTEALRRVGEAYRE